MYLPDYSNIKHKLSEIIQLNILFLITQFANLITYNNGEISEINIQLSSVIVKNSNDLKVI